MTEENLTNLTINYLTEEQYNEAKEAGNINDNELYMTPDDSSNDGVVLYDNNAGSVSSVTLSDNASKFSRIDIIVKGLQYSDYIKEDCITVYEPNGKSISRTFGFYSPNNLQIYIVNPIFIINNTSITISSNQAGTVGASNSYTGYNNCIGITKVIGYK